MGPDLQDVVDEVSRVLATPVVLEDRDFNLVVFAAHADDVDPVRQRTILQRRSSAEVQDWFEAFGIAGSERPVRTPADPARGIVARALFGTTAARLLRAIDVPVLAIPGIGKRIGREENVSRPRAA